MSAAERKHRAARERALQKGDGPIGLARLLQGSRSSNDTRKILEGRPYRSTLVDGSDGEIAQELSSPRFGVEQLQAHLKGTEPREFSGIDHSNQKPPAKE